MRTFLTVLIVTCIIAFIETSVAFSDGISQRPNIVVILADDLGWCDLACYGRKDIKTPVLDRLARQGVRFTQCYANGPECSPTRTALLTARYQQRAGGLECAIGTGNVGRYDDAIRLREQNQLGLPPECTTIATMLKDVGYRTTLSGKWHLGYEPQFAPHLHGFDHAFYCAGGGMDYFHYLDNAVYYNLFEDGRPVGRDGYFTDLATDQAIAFLERCSGGSNADQPFFLYLPFTCPHSPFQGPDDYQQDPLAPDSPLWNQSHAPPDVYIAMIEHMDKCIGRVLGTLDEKQLSDSTLVVFLSDNGGTKSANNGPLNGIKGSTFEGGIRVPGIARLPGVLPAGLESDQVCVTFDFSRSVLRMAGAEVSEDRMPDGIDILQWVQENGSATKPRTLFWRGRRGERTRCAARDGDWKYIREVSGTNVREYLFDLSSDVGEQNDLSSSQPEIFAQLKRQLAVWEEDVSHWDRKQIPVPAE